MYTLTRSNSLRKFAYKLSKETKLPVIEISVRAEKYFKIKKISNASIEEFLGYFNNAEYIITNSFHGLAFSIILEKEFFVGYHENKSLGNVRLTNLLDLFHLKDRVIDFNKKINEYKMINYNNVRKIKTREVKRSLNYLRKIDREK